MSASSLPLWTLLCAVSAGCFWISPQDLCAEEVSRLRYYPDNDADTYGDASAHARTISCVALSGYVPESRATDCDDTDPAINPDTPWYRDSDGDGYGDPDVAQISCEAPSGEYAWVESDEDCDDSDPHRNPAAVWYEDADRDGHGSATSVAACQPPEEEGYVAAPGDCDDTLAAVYPGAMEVCDGLDNDCDPATSEDGLVSFLGDDQEVLAVDEIAEGSCDDGPARRYTPPRVQGGALRFCEGTFPVRLRLPVDITIQGIEGRGATTLCAGGPGPVVQVIDAEVGISGVTIEGAEVDDEDAPAYGGGIDQQGGTVALMDVAVRGHVAARGGGVSARAGALVICDGVLIEGGAATEGGGGVYAEDSAVTIASVGSPSACHSAVEPADSPTLDEPIEIAGARASWGGGIAAVRAELTLSGSVAVSGNEAYQGGGLFLSDSRTWIVDGAAVSDNLVAAPDGGGEGGGVYVEGGALTLREVVIDSNRCSMDGGGVYVRALEGEPAPRLEVFDAEILFNRATQHGGGVAAFAAEVALEGADLKFNDAEGSGGGLYMADEARGVIMGSQLASNDAREFGGGIYQEGGDLEIEDSSVALNDGYGDGGGIYIREATMRAADVAIAANNSFDDGGGLYAAWATVALTGGTSIGGNWTYDKGGGLYMGPPEREGTYILPTAVTLEDEALILANESDDEGGGVYAEEGDLRLSGVSAIVGNLAGDPGGGIFAEIATITLEGEGAVADNVETRGSGGGGVYFYDYDDDEVIDCLRHLSEVAELDGDVEDWAEDYADEDDSADWLVGIEGAAASCAAATGVAEADCQALLDTAAATCRGGRLVLLGEARVAGNQAYATSSSDDPALGGAVYVGERAAVIAGECDEVSGNQAPPPAKAHTPAMGDGAVIAERGGMCVADCAWEDPIVTGWTLDDDDWPVLGASYTSADFSGPFACTYDGCAEAPACD